MKNRVWNIFYELPEKQVQAWILLHRDEISRDGVQVGKAKGEQVAYSGELDDGLLILERAFILANMLDDPLAEALVWQGRAQVLQRHEAYQESLEASERAAGLCEAHGSEFDVALARTPSVYALGALERFDEAEALALWIRPHFVRQGFMLGEADVTTNLAQALTWAWRFSDAWPEYLRARGLYLQLQLPLEAAKILHDMGVLTSRMDQFDLANHFYCQAYPEFEAAGDVASQIKTQCSLARICLRQEQYAAALDYLGQARQDLERLPNSPAQGDLHLIEAQVRWRLNQREQAFTLFREALGCFGGLGRRLKGTETLIVFLGHLLLANETPSELVEGLSILSQEEAYWQQLSVPLFVAWLRLEQAELLLRLARYEEAAKLAKIVSPLFAEAALYLRQAQAETLLADCYWPLQPQEAERKYKEVLESVGDESPLLAARSWLGLGRLALAADDAKAAEQAYGQAFKRLDNVRGGLRTHCHQAGFMASPQSWAREVENGLLTALHLRPIGQEYQILRWLERFKARALSDLLQKPPSQRVGLVTLGRHDMGERARTVTHDSYQVQELARIGKNLHHVYEGIASIREMSASWGNVIEPSSIHRLLDEQTVMISYYTVGEHLYALTVTQREGDIQLHPLYTTLASISEHLEHSRRTIIRSTSPAKLDAAETRLAHWWQRLISPLEERLQDKSRLLILPHRSLFHIPFAALYNKKEGHYLIERWNVQLAPSATVLAHCQTLQQASGGALLVGYAGQPDEADYLAGVKHEIESLASLLPKATILYGDTTQAIEGELLTHLPRHSYIHLAAHACYDKNNPLQSGIRLADDYWLRADTLYNHPRLLNGALVVLSGCEAGRGSPTGLDILGLTSAFLYAGARGIIAGLWRVDDEATAELMIHFHQALQQGTPTAEALRQAQLKLLTSQKHSAPYYWAPWCLSGAALLP
jgi:CHAT domain-containing protein/tetratricopeptide (TPR) repeat protein